MENEGRKIMHHPDFRASRDLRARPGLPRAFRRGQRGVREAGHRRRRARGLAGSARSRRGRRTRRRRNIPLPLYVAEKDNCQVGASAWIARSTTASAFWVAGDQLLKGAALNAVQIAELLESKLQT